MRRLPLGVHKAVPPGVRRRLRHALGRYYVWEPHFDHHRTPELEPGESDGPPDFVGIGVQKAGTTWWYHLIISHPGVFARSWRHKERHFFARYGSQSFGPSDVTDYHGWFPRIPGTVAGEWTPDYFCYPWVPPLLAQAAPHAKLLLILRDPVERFRSGLAHQIRNGSDDAGAVAEAVRRSLYAESLRRWLDHFPAEQLLVLQYERCVAEPEKELAVTYEFLGLDTAYRPERLTDPVNRTAEGRTVLGHEVSRRLEEIFALDIAELSKVMPSVDVSLWSTTPDT